MSGRPSKPASIIVMEGVSHRTKAELAQRAESEAALVTGAHMKMWPEVKTNKVACKEFKRISELLAVIGKDDALHESVVNRYCLLRAECAEFEEKRETFFHGLLEMQQEYKDQVPEIDEETGRPIYQLSASTYYKLLHQMQADIIAIDKQIQSKRGMMLDIEKENLMTIASALRSIPKKAESNKKVSGVAAFMQKRTECG